MRPLLHVFILVSFLVVLEFGAALRLRAAQPLELPTPVAEAATSKDYKDDHDVLLTTLAEHPDEGSIKESVDNEDEGEQDSAEQTSSGETALAIDKAQQDDEHSQGKPAAGILDGSTFNGESANQDDTEHSKVNGLEPETNTFSQEMQTPVNGGDEEVLIPELDAVINSSPPLPEVWDQDQSQGPQPSTVEIPSVSGPDSLPTSSPPLNNEIIKGINEAEKRESCDNVIHSYTTATAHEGFTGKTWLDAFKSLATSCVKNVHKESDKDAVAAIHSMSYALQYSHTLDFHTLSELVTCSVDENGRTVMMKLISRGFMKSIQSPMLWSILAPSDHHELIYFLDKEGNNLLHLAVLSRSSAVVHEIIYQLDKQLTTEELRPYFDNLNKVLIFMELEHFHDET